MGPQLACGHVLDHTLTQRADGGIGTHGELLLSELLETSIFPQDGAPRPHYGLLSTGYQPSIGHPAQRLSRQRFSAMALDMAVAVAAGVPCLRRFVVPTPGRVLLYAAEDAHPIVRQRLESIAAAAGLALRDLDIQVITAPTLRLDLPADRVALQEAVARLQPKLLILDPFVRLHRIDENASGEVAPLLAYLRELQRRYAASVLVVHHAKKGAGNVRA